MVAEVNTAWVKPAYETGGLDHLGVRAPCIHIYGDLLPGINNVTDRLRYYSFYTWIIWSLDQMDQRSFDEETRQLIRRADCLFTMIANYHGEQAEENREHHSAAAVGNLTLGPAVESMSPKSHLKLSTYATEDERPDRYFKNKLGGLGQYYLGSIRDVLLLRGDGQSGIFYTKPRGRPLAEAFDKSVNGSLFWRCVKHDKVTLDDLSRLIRFCPCGLAKNLDEQSILADVLFGRDQHVIPAGESRRDTLKLYLHLAKSLNAAQRPFDIKHFRAAVYADSLGGGLYWKPPNEIDEVRKRWAVYSTNEVLSLGLQGLFFGLLNSRLNSQHEVRVDTAHDMARWFIESAMGAEVMKPFKAGTFSKELGEAKKNLPEISDWENHLHELALASSVPELGSQDVSDDVIVNVIQTSIRTLLALAARLDTQLDPYSRVTFPAQYFDKYPLNLKSFMAAVNGRWTNVPFDEWLGEVLAEWTVNAHIRVALRKLRNQSKATFQVRPTDSGMIVKDAPVPAFSSPRFRQGRQSLIDLGALSMIDDDRCIVTAFGESLLEWSDG